MLNDPGNHKAHAQFLGDIITTAVEGGIGYWSECSHYQWLSGDGTVNVCVGARNPEDRTDAYAVVHELDEDSDDPWGGYKDEPLLIDNEVIRVGIVRLLDGTVSYPSRAQENLWQAAAELDAGMIDADDADCIVQAGLLGEIRYG